MDSFDVFVGVMVVLIIGISTGVEKTPITDTTAYEVCLIGGNSLHMFSEGGELESAYCPLEYSEEFPPKGECSKCVTVMCVKSTEECIKFLTRR